ncbi:MAG TPA: pyruvate kinase [Patescibacteria group bacterium]
MYVKTVATIGPSSESPEVMEGLFDAGLDIARFNFSHAYPEEIYARTKCIRELNEKKGKNVVILQDLCGRRIRIGTFGEGSREIADGEEVTFYTNGAPEPLETEIPINDNYLHNDLKPGDTMLIESGIFRVKITAVDTARQRITGAFEKGGKLIQKKGINVPYVKLTSPAITDKDKQDILLGKELKFEYVAMSFVQSGAEIDELRSLLLPEQKIIAKVEDPIGVANIDEIIQAADGIMVARGDLGVELPLEEIPFIQKEMVAKCRYAGKPSIVATQMLLSMVHHPSPTRAEVSDVANAVLDGTDAVMLSDETAAGAYPVQALQTLVTVARRAEQYLYQRKNNFDAKK